MFGLRLSWLFGNAPRLKGAKVEYKYRWPTGSHTIVLASRSPWPDSIPGGGRRGEFLDPFFHVENGFAAPQSEPLTSDDARIWACQAREVLVGIGILIG